MATDPVVPFQFTPVGAAEGSRVQANFEQLLKYIRDRNDGTVGWDLVRVADGSVGTPSVSFINDTDNGLYRIGTNNWALSTGGAKTIDLKTTGVGLYTAPSTIFHTLQSDSSIVNGWRLEQASTGDAVINFLLTGAQNWYVGADNSQSDRFAIGTDQLGDADALRITTAGEITQPLQPSFLVTDGTGATDVTGDGTSYTELWPTEIYDQGADFSSNTFTAPVTGRYLLTASIELLNVLTTHQNRRLQISTSNRTYQTIANAALAFTREGMTISVIADMDANDTAVVIVNVDNSTKTVDILADATSNFFSGSLIN